MLRAYSRAQLHFELGDEIGAEGKNSQVFLAHDPQLNAELVIKRIEKARITDVDEYFTESTRLYEGAHSNVVPIHYACQDDDYIYLAMPHYRNGSLKRLLQARSLTVREIVVLATEFLSGLSHIHSKRLIHFDIKPDNILISGRGEALLSDFGLAKQMGINGHAGQDGFYGKITPPEAFRNAEFCHRFDIYQAGITLYRMTVGEDEFYRQYRLYLDADGNLRRGDFRHAILNAQFPDRDTFAEHVPDRLRRAIRRCLATEPRERFDSAIDVVNELAEIEGELLDWRYCVSAEGREWKKEIEGRVIKLTVDADGCSRATRVAASGRTARITEYCKDAVTSADIKRFLKGH